MKLQVRLRSGIFDQHRLDTVTTAGSVAQRYTYDGFDRITEQQQDGVITRKTYDALDRTTSQTDNADSADEKTTVYTYLGLTEQLLAEHVNGQLTTTYQHSAAGTLLSQGKHDPDTGTEEDSYYAYNPHGDVVALTDDEGNTRGTYGYTAYGEDDDTQFTGVDKPDPTNPDQQPYNTYRYAGQRFDPATETYDMGFRDYNPGLNRFLTRDTYNGALTDMSLATSPWTMSRYTFAGGNPISLVELDGHIPCFSDGDALCPGQDISSQTALGGGSMVGPAWDDLPDCATGSWIEPGETACPQAGDGPGLKLWLKDIIGAAWEADIDPRLLLTVLVIESEDDRSRDSDAAYFDRFIPDFIRKASIGMANMQQGTFIETVENNPHAFSRNLPPEHLWRASADDHVLSIRAAAFHLRDLIDRQPTRSGTGTAYSQEQLAAIGYNVGEDFMIEIAAGTYPSTYGTSAPMGKEAQRYLNVFNDHWGRTAGHWICVEAVLEC